LSAIPDSHLRAANASAKTGNSKRIALEPLSSNPQISDKIRSYPSPNLSPTSPTSPTSP